jgi:sec-independent protein translocase protein TatC
MKKKSLENKRKEMPFLEHLEELRRRILICLAALIVLSCAAFPLTNIALKILTYPNMHLIKPAKLIFLKPTGMLMVRMEIAIAMGIIGSLPLIIYQLWRFIAPGLLPKEKKYGFPVIFFTFFCFILGAFFAYLAMIPIMLYFLFNTMGTESIEAMININDYMSFMLRIILITGLVYELPVLAFFLARIGLVSPTFLRKFRRHSIVFILILAAVITPTPDPFNMCILAIPLYFLYEISIWVTVLAYRKRQEADAEKKKNPHAKKPTKKPNSQTKSKSHR